MFHKHLLFILWIILLSSHYSFTQEIPAHIKLLLDELPPLSHDRGDRELLYQYAVGDLKGLPDEETRKVIQDLAKRGIGVITFWQKGEKMETQIKEGIRIAGIQKNLGLRVVVDASGLLYGFYDNTPASGHVDSRGNTFFDSSFLGYRMGCPFTTSRNIPVIKGLITAFSEAYKAAGLTVDMVTADWEIDGPIEWNEAWANAKKCTRCVEHIPGINDFISFQSAIRIMRSQLMLKAYTSPISERFPDALITNYGTYPNDGWRYWYDFFEYPQPALPNKKDQLALYRPWYNEFTASGFTMAMPVVYTWYPTYSWYPGYSADYRWFYNMLKVGSNAGENTPSGIPIASFVHWHTTAPPDNPDGSVKQMSKEAYKELLWHLLLRGHDMFFSWCLKEELIEEMKLLQQVYNESLPFTNWFTSGRPVIFDVPEKESVVISGIKLGNRLLIRRTDFVENKKTVTIKIDGKNIQVAHKPGSIQILSIE